MFHALAELVVVVHAGFLVFLVAGGFLAWRWRWVIWAHVAAAGWSLGIVTIGQPCPLTALEHWARRRSGQPVDGRGFIDTYVKGIIFPGALTQWLRVAVFVVVAASYAGLWRRRRRSTRHSFLTRRAHHLLRGYRLRSQ